MNDNDYINCPHFEECSGCELRFAVKDLELLKEARAFFAERGLQDVPLIKGPFEGSRLRAKLAIRKGQIGLYKRGTHEVVSIPQCQVHAPSISKSLELLSKCSGELAIESYDEVKRTGLLRYVQCIVERESKKVSMTLVVTRFTDEIQALAQMLWDQGEFHSLWININSAIDNQIFGPSWKHLFGQEYLWEKIVNTDICFSPSSFGQANLDLFEKLVQEIKQEIRPKANVAEFYAGVGSIGLCLSDKIASLTCVEINPHGKDLFLKSVDKLQTHPTLNYFVGNAGAYFHLLDSCDTVIVDPPRKGLDKPLLDALKDAKLSQTLIYVSCGFTSFKRDATELLQAGWKLKKASIYLFFPGTNHIETLAFFQRDV